MDLVILIHRLADEIPSSEHRSLAGDLRSAALSVPLKIATGNSLFTGAEYLECIVAAQSALVEVSILLQIAVRLGCIRSAETTEAEVLADHTLRMLSTLATRIERQADPATSRVGTESSPAAILPLARRSRHPQR